MNGTTTERERGMGATIFIGVLLMLLGFITLGAQVFTGLATVLFFGWMLIIGGVIQFFHGFFSPSDRTRSFVAGILTFLVGLLVILNPGFTAATVTLLVAILLLAVGVYYVIASLVVRNRNWGWAMIGGLLTAALGIVLLAGWPVTGLTAIGLFVGLAFFISGFSMVIGAFEAGEAPEYGRTTIVGVKGGRAKKDKEKEKEKEEEERESDDKRN